MDHLLEASDLGRHKLSIREFGGLKGAVLDVAIALVLIALQSTQIDRQLRARRDGSVGVDRQRAADQIRGAFRFFVKATPTNCSVTR